jgi:DNA-directed RNA polymerase I, II, and III subunit RPABC1
MLVDEQLTTNKTLQSDEALRLFKIRKTLIKMIEDRGYVDHSEKQIETIEEFKSKIQSREQLAVLAKNPTNNQDIYIEFSAKEKTGVEQIKEFGARIFKQEINNGIMIIKGAVTTLCKQAISELSETGIHIETFEEKELIVNITEHELVPKHMILSSEEKHNLLSKYRLKENQLPKILLTDPIAKYLGLKRTQVVKIIRPSETAGKYITYRIAV